MNAAPDAMLIARFYCTIEFLSLRQEEQWTTGVLVYTIPRESLQPQPGEHVQTTTPNNLSSIITIIPFPIRIFIVVATEIHEE